MQTLFCLSKSLLATLLLCFFVPTDTVHAQKGPASQVDDCTAIASTVWLRVFTVEATSTGPCGRADVTLVVSRSDGSEVLNETYGQDQLFEMAWAETQADLAAALSAWVGNYANRSSTQTLPPWRAGADAPVASEFPFYVDAGVTQAVYEAVRAQDAPMVCYIQGMESMRCVYLGANGQELLSVGVQSFPG